MMKIFNNVCPRDCYGSCRMQISVKDGRMVQITGDKNDPYTRGTLCAKGYAYLAQEYSAERVIYPLKQIGKGSGNWTRISWEQALTEIAQKLITIKEEEKSLLPVCLDKYLGNTGLLSRAIEGFFRSMGYITFMVGSPCDSAGMDALLLNYGSCKKPHPEDMAHSKLILIWGANPAWTAPQQMRYVYEAKTQGGKVVVIDPYLTATAARSDVYVQIKPGMDGFLALGMAKVIVEEGLVDYNFIHNFTYGWEQFLQYLEKFDLEETARRTGISEHQIREIARLYAKSKPASIWLGFGAQHNPSGTQNYRAIDALSALTGNIGIPGGNVHYTSQEATAFTGIFEKIPVPDGSQGLVDKNGLYSHRKIGTGRFSELQEAEPPVRFLWVAGRNPVAQDPDSSRVEEVLQAMETVVVADTTLTATAKFADYFLPVSTFFEYEDVVISNWHYGVAVNEKTLEAPGECKPDYVIMQELAATLNTLSPGFSTFPSERDAGYWLDLEMKDLYQRLEISHYKQLSGRYVRLDLPVVPWQDRIFLTPSGKYEFYAEAAVQYNLSPLPIPALPTQPSTSYPLNLLSVRSYAALNSQFGDLLNLLEPGGNHLLLNPITAKASGIEEGNEACVYNWLGEIRLPVYCSVTIPPDLAVVHIGSYPAYGNELNRLVALQETDLGALSSETNGLSFKNCFVSIGKVQKI